MNLELFPDSVELVFDEFDTNVIGFHLDDEGYFMIQASVYIDENDEDSGKPHFEFNDQSNSQYGGVEEIVFDTRKIRIAFKPDDLFMEEYKNIILHFKNPVKKRIVDFFNNHLFLGEYIRYENSFDKRKMVIQTKNLSLNSIYYHSIWVLTWSGRHGEGEWNKSEGSLVGGDGRFLEAG